MERQGVVFVYFDGSVQALDSEVGERHDAIVAAAAVDPDYAPFRWRRRIERPGTVWIIGITAWRRRNL